MRRRHQPRSSVLALLALFLATPSTQAASEGTPGDDLALLRVENGPCNDIKLEMETILLTGPIKTRVMASCVGESQSDGPGGFTLVKVRNDLPKAITSLGTEGCDEDEGIPVCTMTSGTPVISDFYTIDLCATATDMDAIPCATLIDSIPADINPDNDSACVTISTSVLEDNLCTDLLFSDGFESGDTSSWNATVP